MARATGPWAMTPERFWAAAALFHLIVLLASWRVARAWRVSNRCRLPVGSWLLALAKDLGLLAVFAYVVALLAPVATNLDDLAGLRVGSISGRFMGQFLFGEAILLGVVLALLHRQARRSGRCAAVAFVAGGLLAAYIEGYRIEPKMLCVRRHSVDRADGSTEALGIRILHLTDIQTPAIGRREERALRLGLSYRPDLIVLTGDYVQDALGRPPRSGRPMTCGR